MAKTDKKEGKVPFSFAHKFATPGSHLLSVVLEPDPPPDKRGVGYKLKDYLPGDNRQDFAVEVVPSLPVLVVDGDPSPLPVGRRGGEYLRNALTPGKKGKDPTPLLDVSPLLAEVVGVEQFSAAKLTGDPASRPRVLILCNVGRLTQEQQDAVGQYLADGGGVLVTLGERAEAEFYNTNLYRNGEGLAARQVGGQRRRRGQEEQRRAAGGDEFHASVAGPVPRHAGRRAGRRPVPRLVEADDAGPSSIRRAGGVAAFGDD